jgi:phosphate/sulfate permease
VIAVMAPIVGGLIAGVVFTKISVLKKPSKKRLKNQGAVSKTDQLGVLIIPNYNFL